MAQTAPPLSGEGSPRPLPRGTGRPLRSRDTRPRFQPLDAAWVTVLAALFAVLTFAAWGHQSQSAPCLLTGLGTIVLTYLLGWRASGRPAGVIAGLLLATSGAFATASFRSLPTDLFALFSLAALFAFVAGSSLAALVLAAGAVWLRADGLALGLLLLTFTLLQHRKRAWLGVALFLATNVLAALFSLTVRHSGVPQVALGFHTELWVWLAGPATLFASWFLLPFFGEMADAGRRARWLPIVLWTTLYAVVVSILVIDHRHDDAAVLVPFLPLWFLLAGAGLARLLPVMTGDLPIPTLRYVVATLAVLSLVAIRTRVEWPLVSRHAPAPVVTQPTVAPASSAPLDNAGTTPQAAAPPTAVFIPPAPALKPKPAPHKLVAAHSPNPLPKAAKIPSVKPEVAKPPVRLYVIKNGRLVRRSKWAIQWDLTHPHS